MGHIDRSVLARLERELTGPPSLADGLRAQVAFWQREAAEFASEADFWRTELESRLNWSAYRRERRREQALTLALCAAIVGGSLLAAGLLVGGL